MTHMILEIDVRMPSEDVMTSKDKWSAVRCPK
jgi:hypothetical protein